MQRIRRLLLLGERYVSTIEATHPSNRSILPHAAMFRGRPLRIKIFHDTKKEEFTLEVIKHILCHAYQLSPYNQVSPTNF